MVLLLAAALLACTPSATAPSTGSAQPGGSAPQQSVSTLPVVIRVEPASIAGKGLQQSSLSLGTTVRLFNAGLAIVDDHDQARPYLAATLPTLNTDSWRVFDDGRMETSYQLKPNLTWHDGAPLTADD